MCRIQNFLQGYPFIRLLCQSQLCKAINTNAHLYVVRSSDNLYVFLLRTHYSSSWPINNNAIGYVSNISCNYATISIMRACMIN